MKILAIESSGLAASVAIAEDQKLLAEYLVNYKKTHSQTLLPMLDEIVRMVELDLAEIDAIAVTAGPGSFTGLRIGSATAKGLGFVLGKPLVAIPTLEGLAYNLAGSRDLVCPILDARRGQVYTGVYTLDGGIPEAVIAQKACSIHELIAELDQMGRRVTFLGDGTAVYARTIDETLRTPHAFAPLHENVQRAGAVAALGLCYLKAGKTQTAAEHRPEYLRPSQAERERAGREAQKA